MDYATLFADPATWISLVTLAAMEIVLGIDNIVFITILCGRLPEESQKKARQIGIGLALVSRLGLLFVLDWIMGLKKSLFAFDIGPYNFDFSGKKLLLLVGGLFLLAKASHEIYVNVEHPDEEEHHADGTTGTSKAKVSFSSIMFQIILMDVIFSLDSVITAVGMVPHVIIMVIAMIISVIVMIVFVGPVGDFVQKHASVRILALSFLVLIGALLVGEGFGHHIPKGYIYFAMGFSLMVEMVNLRRSSKLTVVEAVVGENLPNRKRKDA